MTLDRMTPGDTPQTFQEWLQGRSGDVPAELVDRLERQIPQEILTAPLPSALTLLPQAVTEQLHRLLDGDIDSAAAPRETAAELLTLDAVVTYSLEAVASIRSDVDAYAEQLLHDIAATLPEAHR